MSPGAISICSWRPRYKVVPFFLQKGLTKSHGLRSFFNDFFQTYIGRGTYVYEYLYIFILIFFSCVTTVVKLLTPYPFVLEPEPPPYLKISGLIFFFGLFCNRNTLREV